MATTDLAPNTFAPRPWHPLALLLTRIMGAATCVSAFTVSPAEVFINEIHYDNGGTDANEAIEIAGPAGTDLTGWSLVLYNGTGGAPYDTRKLSGIIPNQQNGFGMRVFTYPVNGIQNGATDGVALVNGATLVQFLASTRLCTWPDRVLRSSRTRCRGSVAPRR
jgi:hypothetical protein